MGINFVLPDMLMHNGSHLLAFYESLRTMVSAKNLLYCSTHERKSPTSWTSLRVSKLTAHFHFWVNYPITKNRMCKEPIKQLSTVKNRFFFNGTVP